MAHAVGHPSHAIFKTADMMDSTEERRLITVAKNELKLIASVAVKVAIALLIFEGVAWIGTMAHKQQQPAALVSASAPSASASSSQAMLPVASSPAEPVQAARPQ